MKMSARNAMHAAEYNAEYTIYTFDKAQEDRRLWQKHGTVREMDAALTTARGLFESGRYRRIEVKRKYFDRRINRHVDMTLKTFENGKRMRANLPLILACAAGCSIAAFLIAWLV